jgi:hypothetical protein
VGQKLGEQGRRDAEEARTACPCRFGAPSR